MGLIPGAGGTVSITRRIGRQRASYLALSGASLPVAAAHRWGLVDEIGEIPGVVRDQETLSGSQELRIHSAQS